MINKYIVIANLQNNPEKLTYLMDILEKRIKNNMLHLAGTWLLLSFVATLSTVFIIDNQLVNGVVSDKYFWFYGSMVSMSIATFIYSVLYRQPFRFSLIDVFVFLFFGSVFLSTLVWNDSSANTTKLTVMVLLLILYLLVRLSESCNQNVIQFLCLFIVITGLVEAVWGVMQLYGLRPSQHGLFKLTGSFFNPGPYAGYLAVVFPLALYYFLKNRKRSCIKTDVSTEDIKKKLKTLKIQNAIDVLISFIQKWLGGLACVAILLVLPAAMSRASWLAVICGSIIIVTSQCNKTVSVRKRLFALKKKGLKFVFPLLATALLTASFIGMYHLKKDSADGRMLTWKVSLSALVQHPLGVGLGHFPSAYGEAQVAYFASGDASETEVHIAGNPEYGFNELLQIAIESGMISLLLFVGMLVCAFRGLVKSKQWGVMGSLVALLVFACFSYPFSVLPFLIVFVFLISFSCPSDSTGQVEARFSSTGGILVAAGCIIVSSFCLWKQYPVYSSYKKWKSYQIYYHSGMYREAYQNYEMLYPYLNDQIKFLFEYGRILSQMEQPEKSNEVLMHASQISCDPMLYNIMGKNYQSMKEYDLAEANFRKSSLMVPNRIYPYYLLMKLYIETGDREKATKIAEIVLTKEPKVQSTAVREMREEAENWMSLSLQSPQ